jgi:hypothetical protein
MRFTKSNVNNYSMDEVAKAKKMLTRAGYDTQSLWHIEDVKSRFTCPTKEAQAILSRVLSSQSTKEFILTAIKKEFDKLGL